MRSRNMATILFAAMALVAVVSGGCTSNKASDLEKKYAAGSSKFIDLDGARTHYRDEGSGKPILLMHGIVSSLHTWDGWAEILTKNGFRVIRFDLPGFGLTGPWKKQYTTEEWVAHIDRLMKALGVEKLYVAGNSLGGYLAWQYAVAHPEKVDKLILLDAVGYPQDAPWIISLVSAPVIGNISSIVTPRFIVEQNIKEVYGDPAKIRPEVMERYYDIIMREGNREACREIFIDLKTRSGDSKISQGIPTLKMPVLVMWGELDRWTPLPLIESYKKDLPNAKYIIYKGVGHVPMEEAPEQSAKDAMEFLKSGG